MWSIQTRTEAAARSSAKSGFGGIHHEHSERVSKRPDGARGPAESGPEPEFHQAVQEVLTSLVPVVEAKPEYIKEGVMDCLVEPERIIKFRVLGG